MRLNACPEPECCYLAPVCASQDLQSRAERREPARSADCANRTATRCGARRMCECCVRRRGRARAAAGSGAIAALSADVPRSAFLLVRVASPPAVGAAGLPELPGRPAHPLPSTGGGGLRIGCVRAPAYCLPCALHRGMSPDWAPYVGGWFATADLPRERGSPRPRGPCGCGQRALTPPPPPACAPGPAPAV